MTSSPDQKRWSIRCHLRVVGFVADPQAITEALGVEPTRTWLVGDRVLKQTPARKWKTNGWLLFSGEPSDEPLDKHLDSLAKMLERGNPSTNFPEGSVVELTIGIIDHVREVPIVFPRRIVKLVARLGASIDVSYYHVSGSDE